MRRLLLALFLALSFPAAAADVRRFDHVSVVRVVDGDTCDLVVDLGFSVKTQQRFRLARINTPERGQPGYAEATAELQRLLAGRGLTIEVRGQDKYGRWLVEIFAGGANVNDAMLAAGMAKAYQ
jgi:micrococcal nuclease